MEQSLQPIIPKGVLSVTIMLMRRGAGHLEIVYVRAAMDIHPFQLELLWIRRVRYILLLLMLIAQQIIPVLRIIPSVKRYPIQLTVLRIMQAAAVRILSMQLGRDSYLNVAFVMDIWGMGMSMAAVLGEKQWIEIILHLISILITVSMSGQKQRLGIRQQNRLSIRNLWGQMWGHRRLI